MKKKTWLLAIAGIAVIGITAFLYLQSKSAPNRQPVQQAAPSLTFKVAREDLVNTVEVKGKTSYQKETYVNAPFSADVKSWTVVDGTQVKKGEPLFQLDAAALDDEIAQLRANKRKQELELKLAEFQRDTAGSQQSGGAGGMNEKEAKQRFAETQSREIQQEITKLNVEHMQSQLDRKLEKRQSAQYTASEDGIFLFDKTKQPQSLKENERVGKIVDLTKLQLIATVGEYDLFHLKVGLPVEVKVDALKNTKLQGKIESISKFAKNTGDRDESSSNSKAAEFEVTISLEPHEQLIAGLSLTATVITDKKPGTLVVSTLAIQRDKDQHYVMLQNGQGGLERRDVQIGLETPEKTEILKGLSEGDTVVLQ